MSSEVTSSLIFGVPIEERFVKDFDKLALIYKDRYPSLYHHGNAFIGNRESFLGFEMMKVMAEENSKKGLPTLFEDITWRPKLLETWLKWFETYREQYEKIGMTFPQELPEPLWYLLVDIS